MTFDVNSLLDRPYPPGYKSDCTPLSMASETDRDVHCLKVMIFRIGDDWLGLESRVLKAVTEKKTVHTIPLSKKLIKGVANMRGDLKPVVCLDALIEKKISKQSQDLGFMILISQEKDDWIFIVDELLGIFDISPKNLQNVPVNISKSYGNLIKGLVEIEHKTIAILEEELLFYTLSQSVL